MSRMMFNKNKSPNPHQYSIPRITQQKHELSSYKIGSSTWKILEKLATGV
eukprot:c14624_g1_i1 orf=470-619(-)